LLLKSFSKPVVIASVLAWPLAYLAARAYLRSFIAPIALTPVPFVVCLVLTLAIAWSAVGGQTLRAARRRPAAVLRAE
jgi:putative ABC transport system permease protein